MAITKLYDCCLGYEYGVYGKVYMMNLYRYLSRRRKFTLYLSVFPRPTTLRVIAVRKDIGKFIRNPQEVYDHLTETLPQRQVTIPQLFWETDPEELLVGTIFWIKNPYTKNLTMQKSHCLTVAISRKHHCLPC